MFSLILKSFTSSLQIVNIAANMAAVYQTRVVFSLPMINSSSSNLRLIPEPQKHH